MTRILPTRSSGPGRLAGANLKELRTGTVYGIDDDPLPEKMIEPEIGTSDGLIRLINVVQPPPRAKSAICGDSVVCDKSATGIVVIKNSERSFVKPRSATTP